MLHRPAFLAAAFAVVCSASATAQYTERASVSTSSAQATAACERARLAADGRFVAFVSAAANLVQDDTNGVADVFVRDLQTGVTERVSVGQAGVQANAASGDPAISADGRFVAFNSFGSNLVTGDSNSTADIFVRDRLAGTTTRVSVSSSGVESNQLSDVPTISADGRYVAFHSFATNLVTNDGNDAGDVFVHDRKTSVTRRVSVSTGGVQSFADSTVPAFAGDGSCVAFRSEGSTLVGGDTNGVADVFVHELATGVTARVSVDSAGSQGNGRSSAPSLSFDGRVVVFESRATNLVVGDTNGSQDLFEHDRSTGVTARIGLGPSGAEPNGVSGRPSISFDGRSVGFWSDAPNLVTGDTNGEFDAFLWDRQTGVTQLMSVATNGNQSGDDASDEPSISHDGRVLAFASLASDLVASDSNVVRDVFVRVREPGAVPERETRRVSITSRGFESDGESLLPTISADGSTVVFRSASSDLIPGSPSSVVHVYASDLRTGETTRISVDSAGVPGDGDCYSSSVSGDGRYVAFTSVATNLVVGDTNGRWDAFVRDRVAGTTTRVNDNGQGTDRLSLDVSISPNGRYLAFSTDRPDGTSNVFMQHRASGTTTLVTYGRFSQLPDGPSRHPVVSDDGLWVVFVSGATDLVHDDTNAVDDVFVSYLGWPSAGFGYTTRVSVDSLGRQGTDHSFSPSFTADGRFTTFVSNSRLSPDDIDSNPDVFVHDRLTGTTTRASIGSVDSASEQWGGARISSNGRFVAFHTTGAFADGDQNGAYDVYLRDLLVGRTERVSVGWAGQPGDFDSVGDAVADGGAVAFASWATTLAPTNANYGAEVFVSRQCSVAFESFGHGVAGTGGVMPYLAGLHGDCRDYTLRIWNAAGQRPCAVFFGFGAAVPPLPVFGGEFYVDIAQPWFSVGIPLGGIPDVAGQGSADLRLGTLASLRGQTLVMQALVIDDDAPQHVAFTAGLRLRVGD